jgi:hypothetical protein
MHKFQRQHLIVIAVLVVLGTFIAAPAAGGVVTINFESLPALPTQPNTFAGAGPMQTYSTPGVFSISGGVVFGNPSFLAAFAPQGSSPNTYGTADFGDPSLLPAITLNLPAAELVTLVTGVLFNGQPVPESYTLTAFSGINQVGSNSFTNVQANTSTSGFRNFSLSSTPVNPITRVVFTTPNADVNGWDFFVDTITLTAVPEPSAFPLLLTGMAVIGYRVRRRR